MNPTYVAIDENNRHEEGRKEATPNSLIKQTTHFTWQPECDQAVTPNMFAVQLLLRMFCPCTLNTKVKQWHYYLYLDIVLRFPSFYLAFYVYGYSMQRKDEDIWARVGETQIMSEADLKRTRLRESSRNREVDNPDSTRLSIEENCIQNGTF